MSLILSYLRIHFKTMQTSETLHRESQHTSSDPRDHYTGVQLREVAADDNIPTDGKSSHFVAKK